MGKPSLIDQQAERDASQPSLFAAGDDFSGVATESASGVPKGVFTGERLYKYKPDVYRCIVAALGQGLSTRFVSKLFKVHTATVRAVREREQVSIDTVKNSIVRNLAEFAELGTERMVDEVGKMDRDKLALGISVVIEKMLLLQGQATSRVEHTKRPTIADIKRIMDVEAVTVVEMGSGARGEKQVLAVDRPALGNSRAVSGALNATSDSGSPVIAPFISGEAARDTVCDTGSPSEKGREKPVLNSSQDAGSEEQGQNAGERGGEGGPVKTARGGMTFPSTATKNFHQRTDPSGRPS